MAGGLPRLRPCLRCGRHVNVSQDCPFCASTPSGTGKSLLRVALSSAVLLAAACSPQVAAVYGGPPEPERPAPRPGTDEHETPVEPPRGEIYGGPPDDDDEPRPEPRGADEPPPPAEAIYGAPPDEARRDGPTPKTEGEAVAASKKKPKPAKPPAKVKTPEEPKPIAPPASAYGGPPDSYPGGGPGVVKPKPAPKPAPEPKQP